MTKPKSLYTATFTFAKREFDDEFHALDAEIAAFAKSIPGYLGEESWENPATGLVATVYYWDSLDALRRLTDHPAHRLAKAQQARWLDGYRVVIAEVLRTYGDGGLPDPVAAHRETP